LKVTAKPSRCSKKRGEESGDLKTSNELLTAYQKFSSLLARGGDVQSTEYAEKSIAVGERLLAAHPENNEQVLKLSGAYLYLGDSLATENAAERIKEIYRKALDLAEKVYKAEPTNPMALRRVIGLSQRWDFSILYSRKMLP
jgi:hypothetical protein